MLPASPLLSSPPLPSIILGVCFSVYLLSLTFCHTAPPPPQRMYPCTASIYPHCSLPASISSYFLLTLSLHSTIISSLHINHLILFGPIVLFSFHLFMRTSKTTGLCCVVTFSPANALQSFTLLSCCCHTTIMWSSVLCRPLL